MIIQPIYITVHQLFSPTSSICFVGIFLFFSSLFSILLNKLIFEKRLVCLAGRCIILEMKEVACVKYRDYQVGK